MLRAILAANRETVFGKKYDFANITSIEEFQRAVPCHDYEMLRPYIEEQEKTGAAVLTAEAPVMYARTSGTTGKHKLIPLTDTAIRRYRKQQRLLSSLQHKVSPESFHGKALAIVSPAVEGRLPSGRAYGSMSGYVYQTMPALVRRRAVVPASVLDIEDYDTRYQLILRLALGERDITYLGTANPSTYLRLLFVLKANQSALIDSVASGRLPAWGGIPDNVRRDVSARVRADVRRAKELAGFADRGELTYANLWPNIRLLTTWTAGNCALALNELRPLLPPTTKVLELGYVSSEFRGTLSVGEGEGELPLLQHHFFEFVERSDWEQGQRRFLTLDQLEQGREYYIFVTTGALYRYAMDDVLSVTGFVNRTPLLRFRQKGKGCTSITGEKLYESQLLQAMEDISRVAGLRCRFFILVADEKASVYRLYAESDSPISAARASQLLDHALAEINIEYGSKRSSGRLSPIEVVWLRAGTSEEYVRHCVARGQREGQFKHIALQYVRDVTFPFEQYAQSLVSKTG